MQQHLRPHELAARQSRRPGGIDHPSLRPSPIASPPRRRSFDQGGWVRAAIVLIVTFFVVWFGYSAVLNEIDGGKGGGDPWFNVPPFRQPDYRIPDPPDWVNSRPPLQPPPSSGRGNGWRECRPGPNGWDCGGPDQRGRR